ncbi:F-box/WD repeat-containing protein TBL1X [Phytophthora cinnamomi]|uniref:F-box/WD repeat-containing protein TBL1X n=1 Tax=Phytophthora cinnamomi TaxID=4785 RepID=UPI00355A6DCB|nr:F-box/WD repeat-containing protein TBL1X [Phytophthora cinnamomi]
MISFDTFAGPRGRVREADLDSAGLLVLAEQPTPAPELFPALCDSPEDEFYESLDDDGGDSCDLFHECNDEGDVAAMQDQEQDRDQRQEDQATEAPQDAHTQQQQQEQASGGRVRQLVELLTLQSHNVGDARSALVDKLLGVVKVHELLLTRATEEQIADAANDAITDEILASVDLEERRRNELALKEQQQQLAPLPVAASTLFNPGQLSPFRVLELVDVLDSTTGGMVKRVLTNVRRRAPLNARMVRDNEMERTVEFFGGRPEVLHAV